MHDYSYIKECATTSYECLGLIVVQQEFCETDVNGRRVQIAADTRNGVKTIQVNVKRMYRIFCNYTHIRQHASPEVDYMYLITIKKERRENPEYFMVLFDGRSNGIVEVRNCLLMLKPSRLLNQSCFMMVV